ncbi:MAG: deoxyribonuclease IV [Coriobacteriales bacterium]|nr:deoxyribonuclease IV [Coriobacteriales bacterium]
MLVGAHVSVAKGLASAVEYAQGVGCETLQIFARNPRRWHAEPLDAGAPAEFAAALREHAMGPAFTHTAYLINLASLDEQLRTRSVITLADELARGALLGCAGVVTHTGTAADGDEDAAAFRLGTSIAEAFELAGEGARSTRLLLENTAGAGSTFGCEWRQLGRAIDESGTDAEHLGVCIDTCHAFAYGFALHLPDGWRSMVGELDREVGIDRIGLIHANDCKFELGSKRDRHAWIGDGYIGLEGFGAMMCTPELVGLPCICEMPGEVPEKDVINVERLRSLRDSCRTM